MSREMDVATTINHLGGEFWLRAVLGGRRLLHGEDYLQFDVGRGARLSANRVIVRLQPDDLYSVTLYRQQGLTCRELEKVSNIFCENLKQRVSDMLDRG